MEDLFEQDVYEATDGSVRQARHSRRDEACGKQETKMSEQKTDALATTDANQALAPAPDWMPKSRRGFEDTVQSDLMIPRLGLAQANSSQVTDGDPARIDGAVPGHLFNSVTGQLYGEEIIVQVIRKMPLRAMEWRPIEDGGGIIDPDVPLDDPRLKWGTSGDKKKDKPQAMLYRDFLACVLPGRDLIALSFKSSGITAAKNLWGLTTTSNRDCFAVKIKITTGTKLKPQPHKVYKVALAGWVSEEEFNFGAEMHEAMKTIDATQIHHEDPDAFDPEELERQAAQSNAPDPKM